MSNYFLAEVAGSTQAEFWLGYATWRWMFWMELIPAVLFFVLLFFIPESPRYFVLVGKVDEAKQVLIKLFSAEEIDAKLDKIKESLKNQQAPSLSDLIVQGTRKVHPIVWVALGLATFQQLVGINVVFYYGAVLWQSVGFSEGDALMINVISGAVSIGAVAISITLIDKIGRKPLLFWGSV